MIRIRRFGVIRTATVLGVLYALVTLIFFAIFGVFLLLAGSQQPGIPGLGIGAGAVGVLLFGFLAAALYGVLGWIFTAIFCLLYNWSASFTGGVEFELQAVAPPQPAPTWAPPAPPPGPTPGAG